MDFENPGSVASQRPVDRRNRHPSRRPKPATAGFTNDDTPTAAGFNHVVSLEILRSELIQTSDLAVKLTTSRRLADRKVERFEKNINKRGTVAESTMKKGYNLVVGPVLLGFFVFVVIGSSLFQIIRTATSGGMA